MRPAIRSLNTKLLLIVGGFLILSSILGSVRVGMAETDRLEALYHQRLQTLSQRYQTYLTEDLHTRAQMLKASREVLLHELNSVADRDYMPDLSSFRQDDGSYRLLERSSGVFVQREAELNLVALRHIQATGQVWERLGPAFQEMFSAFYFISEERLMRVWPLKYVTAHRPAHDMREEVYYRIAAPEHNSAAEARWTPVYYDEYTQQWLLTLVLPVYQQNKFIGVIGGDMPVSYLLSRLDMLDADANRIGAFIVDSEKQILLSRPVLDSSRSNDDNKEVMLATDTPLYAGLHHYIQQFDSDVQALGDIHRHVLSGNTLNIVMRDFPLAGWRVGFYFPQSIIEERFAESMKSVYINISIVAICMFAVLFFSLRHFVIRRITALASATSAIQSDHWAMSVPDKGNDEISQLGVSINSMLDHIRHLVNGLNSKISELDQASYESRKLMSAIENSTSLVVILNRDWKLEYANSQYWQISGLQETQEYTGYELLLLAPDNAEGIRLEDIYRALTGRGNLCLDGEETHYWQREYQTCPFNGKCFWLMQTIAPIFSSDGELAYYVCVGQDISALKEKQEEVEKLAYFDPLTGLANRVQFKTQLVRNLAHIQRDNSRLALFYLDLDHFKNINDTLGHEVGDQLLQAVAERLQQCLRTEDLVARLGGDEFAVLLDAVEGPQYIYRIAQKIIHQLNQPVYLNNKEIVVGVSIGITIAPDDGKDSEVLMKNADLAMYQAKERGRNGMQFYTADMNLAVERRLTIERELRLGLRLGQFELYYQPLIDFSTGKIFAAEALVRWNHPSRGVVNPSDFIPEAEDSGLIVPLGKWVLKTACSQVRNMQKALGFNLMLSVNLSNRQLIDTDFNETLDQALSSSGLGAKYVNLEVTESTLMRDTQDAIKQLEAIRARGCNIAIDDFGTGYSSLSHLKRLPINSLKIDRSFVQGLPENEEDRAITTLIIAMANSLHYKVVVEGVETPEQHEFLAAGGCHYGQGYLYGKPMPLNEFMSAVFTNRRGWQDS